MCCVKELPSKSQLPREEHWDPSVNELGACLRFGINLFEEGSQLHAAPGWVFPLQEDKRVDAEKLVERMARRLGLQAG